MAHEHKHIVTKLLEGIFDPSVVLKFCAPDVTYVSLNYSNPDLHKVMPWCGTGQGVDAINQTFHDVPEFWNIDSFTLEDVIGEDDNVAVFGRFTYTSAKLRKTVTSPFAILCKLKSGKLSTCNSWRTRFAPPLVFGQEERGSSKAIPTEEKSRSSCTWRDGCIPGAAGRRSVSNRIQLRQKSAVGRELGTLTLQGECYA